MGISVVGVPEEGERIPWVDALKGIGILCVVFGYTWQGVPRLMDYLCSFNIPLLFIVFGFLYDAGKYRTDYRRFLRRRVMTLVLPYFAFAMVSLVCWNMFGFARGNSGPAPFDARDLLGIFTANNSGNWPEINPVLWFLPCLFVSETIFTFLERRIRAAALPVVIVLLALAGYLGSRFLPFRFPWGMEIALTGAALYGLGFFIRRKRWHALIHELSVSRSALGFLFLASLFLPALNCRVDLGENRLGHILCFYSALLASTALFSLLAARMENNPLLRFLGNYSLVILGLHFALAPIAGGMLSFLFRLPVSEIRYSIPLGAVLAVLQLVLITPALLMIHNGFPLHRIRIPALPVPAIDRASVSFRPREKRMPERAPGYRFPERVMDRERFVALRFAPERLDLHPERPLPLDEGSPRRVPVENRPLRETVSSAEVSS